MPYFFIAKRCFSTKKEPDSAFQLAETTSQKI